MQRNIEAFNKELFGQLTRKLEESYLSVYTRTFTQNSISHGVPQKTAENKAIGLAKSVLSRPLANKQPLSVALKAAEMDLLDKITPLLYDLYKDGDKNILYNKIKSAVDESERKMLSLAAAEDEFFKWWGTLDAEKNAGIQSYMFVAVLDERTTDICQSLEGKIFPVAAAQPGVNYPPMHYGCRSTVIYSLKSAESFQKQLDGLSRDKTYAEKVAEQLILGNYSDEMTLGGTIAAILAGLIPYVGQAADIRDLAADLQKLGNDGLSAGTIFDLSLSMAAVIPGAGDALKALGKGVKQGAEELGQQVAKNIAEQTSDAAIEIMKKKLNDILSGTSPGKVTNGKATQFIKSGGYEQALADFDSLQLTDIRDIPNGKGKIGKLLDGRTVNVRSVSSESSPTLEIYDGKKSIKIRYKNLGDLNGN